MSRLYHATTTTTTTAVLITFLLLTVANLAEAYLTPNDYTNMVNQFLSTQNAARKALGMRPLIWDEQLARYAEWYANQRRFDCRLKHSDGPYGENIFWGSGTGWSPVQAAAAWVMERKWYNYLNNSCAWGQQCGHYTQIVWKDTKKVGCARVNCFGGRGVFMTCNYDPPGNYVGERPY